MARWSEVEREVPELVAIAREFLDAGVHKTLATLRRDGSPRISGTEIILRDGDLWLGSGAPMSRRLSSAAGRASSGHPGTGCLRSGVRRSRSTAWR
jgi:hypothetical protein